MVLGEDQTWQYGNLQIQLLKIKQLYYTLTKNLINKYDKKYIYTGCQILNRSVFINEKKNNFSINKIWSDLIKSNQLIGFESKLKFYHATNLNVFKKLQDL